MKIVCVTPNVACDRTLTVPGFRPGRVWRAAAVRAAPGGKGLNVARACRRLGLVPLCAGLLGGPVGHQIAQGTEAEGLAARWTWGTVETRTCVIVLGDGGEATVINEPGSPVGTEDWERLIGDVALAAEGAAAVTISGSLPPGVAEGAFARLIARAGAGRHRTVWVDASGSALTEALGARPFAIKVNASEAADAIGQPIACVADAIAAARTMRRRGIPLVAITLGHDGAVLCSEQGDWHAGTAAIDVVSPVGSGDCFLAGLVTGFLEGSSPADALRLATACGAANARRADVAAFERDALGPLLAASPIRAISGAPDGSLDFAARRG